MDSLQDVLPTVPYWLGLQRMVEDAVAAPLILWALRQGYVYAREIPEQRVLAVAAMTYGKGRLRLLLDGNILDSW